MRGFQVKMLALLLLLWAPAVAGHATAQEGPAAARKERDKVEQGQRVEGQRLPPDSTLRQVAELPGRTLRYAATAGSLPLQDPQGKLVAEIAYVAYVLDGAEPSARPVTFVFNGGPGAASAYLHFGGLGPKRLAFGNQGDTPSKPPVLLDNAETWLDFTDLVFVDPVGTGYSRAEGEGAPKQFWSVDGDARTLARIVAKYLARTGRLASPKYLVGESYGGFRVPKIASLLQGSEGVGVSGLVLISPVLDFGLRTDSPSAIEPIAGRLPSFAAARLERDGPLSRERLAETERYAAGDYLLDLRRGPRDRDAVARMTAKVAELTGLDRAFVERLGARIDTRSFAREIHRERGRIGSAYDVMVSSLDPNPSSARAHYEDPVLDAAAAPLTSAATDYLARTLNWKVEGRYNLLNGEVSRHWDWGGGLNPPEVASDLRKILALDGKLRVVVAHGFTDLVTPYFDTKLVLDQLPDFGDPGRVRLEVFPGGHMFYTRDASRAALRDAVKTLYEGAAG